MQELKVEVREHPARKEGTKEPLLPDDRSIYVNGVHVGYVNVKKPGRPICMIYHSLRIGSADAPAFLAAVKAGVEQVVGHPVGDVHVPPVNQGVPDEDEEEFE
jgi:hypothetical protein